MDSISDQIKYGDNPDDIILLFKTLDHDSENTSYIYSAMQNPYLINSMDIIMGIFIKKGYHSAIYYFIDGWPYYINSGYLEKYRKMMIDILRTDLIYLYFRFNKLDTYYINLLKDYFQINYDAEIASMG